MGGERPLTNGEAPRASDADTLALSRHPGDVPPMTPTDPQVIGWDSGTAVWTPQCGPEEGTLLTHLQCAELSAELSAEVPPEWDFRGSRNDAVF
jgi:hypothetical protein